MPSLPQKEGHSPPDAVAGAISPCLIGQGAAPAGRQTVTVVPASGRGRSAVRVRSTSGRGDGPRDKGAPQDTSGQTRIFKTEETGGGEPEGTAAISADEAHQHGLAREIIEVVLEDGAHPLEGAGPWTVGRSQENDITVNDPNVSRRHARISRADDGFVVEDLGSTNGTLLDGAPIDRERIDGGDELTFGQTAARFVRRIDVPDGTPRGGRPSPSRRR